MGDRLWAGKPSRYVTSHLGQLSLSSLCGRQIKYGPVWLGLRRGMFTCVGWQVTLCDPIWQVTLRSCAMGFHYINILRETIMNDITAQNDLLSVRAGAEFMPQLRTHPT